MPTFYGLSSLQLPPHATLQLSASLYHVHSENWPNSRLPACDQGPRSVGSSALPNGLYTTLLWLIYVSIEDSSAFVVLWSSVPDILFTLFYSMGLDPEGLGGEGSGEGGLIWAGYNFSSWR